METNEVDPFALAMLRDLQEVYLDLALLHTVAVAGLDMRSHPNADAASDLPSTDAVSETSRKEHLKSLRWLPLLGGCLLESQRLASNEEADCLLQASGLRLLVLGGLYPPDIPSTM